MDPAFQRNSVTPTSGSEGIAVDGFASEEERDQWIDSIADRVVASKLQSVVEFFLESHLPATTLLYSAGLFLQPLLAPFVGVGRTERLQAILADRSQVEKLLRRIREMSESESRKN